MLNWPYENCKIYKIWNKSTGRWIAVIFKNEKERTTISWAKFVLQNKLKRGLLKGEEADHIDKNKLNDEEDNLQILSRLENQRKASRGTKIVQMKCFTCSKIYFRRSGNDSFAKGHKHSFCSRKCFYDFIGK